MNFYHYVENPDDWYARHYLLRNRPDENKVPKEAREAWLSIGFPGASQVEAAFVDRELVGFFRYYTYTNSERYFEACGTWVSLDFRRQGIAKKLWARAIKRYRPTEVKALYATEEGSYLLSSVEKGLAPTGTKVFIRDCEDDWM